MPITPVVAAVAVWIIWGLSWLAAWQWSARTERRETAGREASYRLLNIVGFAALFGGLFPDRGVSGIVRPLWVLAPVAGWALVALAAAGMAFAWSGRLALGRLWSAAVMRKEGHRIIDHGPYALVRHPIYTGLLTGALALAAIEATPIALAGLVMLTIGYAKKARVEERFLAAALCERDYAAYRRRVPMLVPFTPAR